MAYKVTLGLSEITVGVLLAVPSFDRQATFARLSAEELREDPSDRLVTLISRNLPALVHHRGLVAPGLIVFGLAKLVAAAAMWEGQEWGGYLLTAMVALLLPLDLRQAVVDPTVGHWAQPPVGPVLLGVLYGCPHRATGTVATAGQVPTSRPLAEPSCFEVGRGICPPTPADVGEAGEAWKRSLFLAA